MFAVVGLLLVCYVLGDAPFEQVRTHVEWSRQNVDEDQPGKYFHESSFSGHHDGRFADRQLGYEERNDHLTALCHTYLSTMNDLGIETWLMHGTLLGWYWNRKVLPWDNDLDVMITEKSLYHLANYYNMTVYHHHLPELAAHGRDYLLEVNPHYAEGGEDSVNRIDARWVDMDTGLFIDVTTLRRNRTAKEGGEDALMVKDLHSYKFDDVFPLRISVFEDFPVRIPYAYADLLVNEYGENALVDMKYGNHRFDAERGVWVKQEYAGVVHPLD
ncbi:hypothetical protein BAUCODRAFT_63386 [Baudoinia panamericana UAMH 10762]|uniref:LicD/FKTN/FKRP nucleotidyltransferase domain-containing protein n=1 Tax=Baudoinia panamericana (strain UAMH 10762) TaxID=717646 RepID=M2NJV7_BAUPA|nr:uncharacterized protein BAUCODRAFT_63386 [Baudoinia panamericana UAMH 10762]EMC99420.1 hypothetical protein BAUCODRAFT_63386 [Baudoinia panamericana UAMH 10762]